MTSPTIRTVRSIATSPGQGSIQKRLIVVKIETSEPGLYGLGCATFTQRHSAVCTVVDEFLDPLLSGHRTHDIEDIWQLVHQNAYWRSGPIVNNAMSGVDMALWDIKGKLAGMPVYQLFGGKCREAAAVYRHAGGGDPQAVADRVAAFLHEGVTHVRSQLGGYGGAAPATLRKPTGAKAGAYFSPATYMRETVKLLTTLREQFGDDVELLHDVHERLPPVQAIGLAKELEAVRLFFLEDLLPPEQIEWFGRIREQCSTPLAMGELFVNPKEWLPLIETRSIDFIRCHISAIGGLTPARKLAILSDAFGIRTAWHGPGDVSPVGHAANIHLDLSSPNFGIQEWAGISQLEMDMFPGSPELRQGYVYANDKPGLGIDIDEDLAAKYPCPDGVLSWTQVRRPDGSLNMP